jgi:hypothetical protein
MTQKRRPRAGVFKRDPEIDWHLHGRYAAISKAGWAEAFWDLYRQTINDAGTDEEIMADAERRTVILETYRKGERPA